MKQRFNKDNPLDSVRITWFSPPCLNGQLLARLGVEARQKLDRYSRRCSRCVDDRASDSRGAPMLEPMDAKALEVTISELMVATADGYDPALDKRITDVLLMLRKQLRMDVVFVSEFVDGERVFRFVHGGDALGITAGESGPLEESYCQRVVEGRMPELVPDAQVLIERGDLFDPGIKVGAHLSTPVVLSDGRVYGTVCCFSAAPQPDLQASALACLRQCARLLARKVDGEQRQGFATTQPADWPATERQPLDKA
ncbi:MAG: GAF domain-containing protein [Rubrivivax sp.]|nr:MAG: GAF domain-containing protein [Rubrivivax sp.]